MTAKVSLLIYLQVLHAEGLYQNIFKEKSTLGVFLQLSSTGKVYN